MNSASKWLTSEEAAKYLKIEKRTVTAWARDGKLKGYALSGTKRVTWRFLQNDLDAILVPSAALITEGGR